MLMFCYFIEKLASNLSLDKVMNIVCYMQEKWYMVGMKLNIPPTVLGDICKECYDNQIPADSTDTFCCIKMFRYWLSFGDDISIDTLLNVLETIVIKYKMSSIKSALESQLVKDNHSCPPEKQQQSYLKMITKLCVQLNKSEVYINDVLVYLKLSNIDLIVFKDVATFLDLITSLEKYKYLNKTDLSWLKYIVDYTNNAVAEEIIKNYETCLLADKIYWCSNYHSTGTFLIGKISNQPEIATIKNISFAKSVASEVAGIQDTDSILNSSEVGSVICYWKITTNKEFKIPENLAISVKLKCKHAGLTHIGKATNGNKELVRIESMPVDDPKGS